ncbi:lysophospholipid acyltransferase family protein [Garciella nitratireducens]|uniref:1-acyl-sn-glycerol-3-phosphate acyltransferase n=1 Tax=Garciella nitratireducens DSM 15102 TaxID=1121911 RepID=A0A1T4JV48_9FIRM|nr:lysophospholipid acyltransferase family protein [Garciella nitratireducens]SJZ34102.1 1-acyl-sn-glycerol-3-phosphate acyltransferase [Garciella nitratireducens DSM 15102]
MLYSIVKSILKPILKIFYRVEVRGKEHFPEKTGYIICSNHTHNLDPLVVACFMDFPIYYMAKKELFQNKLISYFLKKFKAFPVDRQKPDIAAIKTAIKVLKNNKVLGIFPEGTRVKSGEVSRAEPGIAMIAIKAKVKIIPIGISGGYKLGRKVLLNCGQPISLEKYYGKKLSIKEYKEISQNIMKEIKKL